IGEYFGVKASRFAHGRVVQAASLAAAFRFSPLYPHPSSSRVRDDLQEVHMLPTLWKMLIDDEGQDITEYAVLLAVILIVVVGTVRFVGSNANNVFSATASSIQ